MNNLTMEEMNERIEKLQKAIEELAAVTFTTVIKNGVELTGIQLNETKSNIKPIVYLNNYIENNQNDDYKEMAAHIIATLKEHDNEINSFNQENLLNKEFILNNITASFEKHLEQQKYKDIWDNELRIPYYDKTIDMVFRINASSLLNLVTEEEKMATIKVRMEFLLNAGFDNTEIDEIIDIALRNSFKETSIQTMGEVLKEMMPEMPEEMLTSADIDMYVISNKSKTYGAVNILNKDALNMICARLNTEKIIILPSSIHEILVIKDTGDDESYLQMVKEVNETQVDEKDRLGDFIIKYNTSISDYEIINFNKDQA